MSKREIEREATYEDLLRLPDDVIAELVAGELFASPRPQGRHNHAMFTIGRRVATAFQDGIGGPGGWWFLIEPEVHLGRDIFVPDVSGWRCETLPVIPPGPFIEVAPDWVCEIVSPRTTRLDRVKKMPAYAGHGVAHVWITAPELRSLEIYRLKGEHYSFIAGHEDDEIVRAEPFEEIELRLADLWIASDPLHQQ